jgi:hypothetical protein
MVDYASEHRSAASCIPLRPRDRLRRRPFEDFRGSVDASLSAAWAKTGSGRRRRLPLRIGCVDRAVPAGLTAFYHFLGGVFKSTPADPRVRAASPFLNLKNQKKRVCSPLSPPTAARVFKAV